jgi:hypothetical protein
MLFFKSLLKEEFDLDNEILRNRIMQMKGLHNLIMKDDMTAPDRAELLDGIRALEDTILTQLANRAKSKARFAMFRGTPADSDKQIKDELIRLRGRREAEKKYRSMKLTDLMHNDTHLNKNGMKT